MEEMKEIAGQITVRNRNGWAGEHGGWRGRCEGMEGMVCLAI